MDLLFKIQATKACSQGEVTYFHDTTPDALEISFVLVPTRSSHRVQSSVASDDDFFHITHRNSFKQVTAWKGQADTIIESAMTVAMESLINVTDGDRERADRMRSLAGSACPHIRLGLPDHQSR